MSVSGASVRLPGWVADRLEARLNAALPNGGLRLDRVEVGFDSEGTPRVSLRNVDVTDRAGNRIAQLNQLGAGLLPAALIRGRVEPSILRLSGAQITVRRNSEGAFSLGFGGVDAIATEGTLASILDAVDRAFATPPLEKLARVEATDLTITLEDARSGRVWQATGGRIALSNEADGVAITVVSEVFNGTEDLAGVQLSFRSRRGSPAASLGVTFENATAKDIALQSPALAFLDVLDAPISGSMRATVNEHGTLEQLAATLEMHEGALSPSPVARPMAFDRARVYLTYDPEAGKIEFAEISAETALVSLVAEGHAYLENLKSGWPESLIGQFRLSRLDVSDGRNFEQPIGFASGVTDIRLRLDPFAIDIARLDLDDGGDWRRVSGTVGVGASGWQAALDLETDRLEPQRLLELWPVSLAPGTRNWIAENVKGGVITDLSAALRVVPDRSPLAALEYTFEDAEVRVMRHLPPISAAAGRASLFDARYAMALTSGQMTPRLGPSAHFAGSTFVVADTRMKPANADLSLEIGGALASVLRLLDNRPFRVLERARRADDILSVQARAAVSGTVRFPLKRGVTPADVSYAVRGHLSEVRTDRLVPGRTLRADRLAFEVTPEEVVVRGRAQVDAVPVEARWIQPIAPGTGDEGSVVLASLDLTQETLAALGVTLPRGTVTGSAQAEARIALRPDQPAEFSLTSDLVGAGLRLTSVGWSKPPRTPGSLEVTGRLAERPEIDNLSISAPGLSATGTIEPGPSPGRVTASFDRVRIGNWLSAPVTLTGRGNGRPADIRVAGGEMDLRAMPAVARSGGAAGAPLRVALDRLTVSDAISLTNVRAELATGGGLSGRFEARVNGGTAITGTVVPTANGTALRIRGEDGGGVLRDAGILENARDGQLELILVPKASAGAYDGQLRVDRVRLRNAPGLASLLDAVSIVGIIDELQGPGILFERVDARFDLTPNRVIVREGSAVGASLGISMDGIYEIGSRRMDMQGVISPIYLLNGIGQIFTRRGEGLFGFAYRMTGRQGETRVQVNPLSILTPGMFREIFRRPPPEAVR